MIHATDRARKATEREKRECEKRDSAVRIARAVEEGERGMRRSTWIAALLALAGFEPLRRANPEVERGNDDFRNKRYEQAVERYQRAKEALPGSPEVRYDLGTALLALGRTEDAVRELREAARLGAGAKAHYNLGNAHLDDGRYAEAIDAYRRSLRLDPRDSNAKWNLEMALRMKEEDEKKQKKNQSQDEDQDPRQEEPQEQPEKQEGQKPEQPEQPEEAQDDPGQKPQEQPESQPESAPESPRDQQEPTPADEKKPPGAPEPTRPAGPGDPEQADQAILDALERGEKNLQAQRLKALYRRRRVEKDW